MTTTRLFLTERLTKGQPLDTLKVVWSQPPQACAIVGITSPYDDLRLTSMQFGSELCLHALPTPIPLLLADRYLQRNPIGWTPMKKLVALFSMEYPLLCEYIEITIVCRGIVLPPPRLLRALARRVRTPYYEDEELGDPWDDIF